MPENHDSDSILASASSPDREPSLTKRVFRAGLWGLTGNTANRGLQLAMLVILARMLAPADFGLFAIIMLALGIMESFTESGFEKALIQREKETESYLDPAWTVQAFRGLLLSALLFLTAPLVGWFFNEPAVIPLLRVICFAELFKGFRNIGVVYFQKDLQFHKKAAYEISSNVLSFFVGIISAYFLRNVWALVLASLTREGTQCLLSYILHPYRPKISIDPGRIRELFGYGKWLLGNSIIGFMAMKIDRIALGRLLGAAPLGFYNIADRIGGILPTELTRITSIVMMPAYVKVQSDKKRLGRAFLHVFSISTIVVSPLCAFIIITAPELISTVLGESWLPSVVPLQILAVTAFLRSLIGTSTPLFLGSGYPHITFWKSLVRGITTIALVYPLTMQYGPSGTALACLFGVIALSPFFLIALSITSLSVIELIKSLWPGALLAITTGAGSLIGKILFDTPSLSFFMQIVFSGLFSAATVLVLKHYDIGPWIMIKQHWFNNKTGQLSQT